MQLFLLLLVHWYRLTYPVVLPVEELVREEIPLLTVTFCVLLDLYNGDVQAREVVEVAHLVYVAASALVLVMPQTMRQAAVAARWRSAGLALEGVFTMVDAFMM